MANRPYKWCISLFRSVEWHLFERPPQKPSFWKKIWPIGSSTLPKFYWWSLNKAHYRTWVTQVTFEAQNDTLWKKLSKSALFKKLHSEGYFELLLYIIAVIRQKTEKPSKFCIITPFTYEFFLRTSRLYFIQIQLICDGPIFNPLKPNMKICR